MYSVCRCTRASFSPEISEAGAVKGLKATGVNRPACSPSWATVSAHTVPQDIFAIFTRLKIPTDFGRAYGSAWICCHSCYR